MSITQGPGHRCRLPARAPNGRTSRRPLRGKNPLCLLHSSCKGRQSTTSTPLESSRHGESVDLWANDVVMLPNGLTRSRISGSTPDAPTSVQSAQYNPFGSIRWVNSDIQLPWHHDNGCDFAESSSVGTPSPRHRTDESTEDALLAIHPEVGVHCRCFATASQSDKQTTLRSIRAAILTGKAVNWLCWGRLMKRMFSSNPRKSQKIQKISISMWKCGWPLMSRTDSSMKAHNWESPPCVQTNI